MKVNKRDIENEFTESLNVTASGRFDEDHDGGPDKSLFGRISSFLRAELDIEEIENDPLLAEVQELASESVLQYRSREIHDKGIGDFIVMNLPSNTYNSEARRELKEILQEISDQDINSITSEWVKEWHKEHQKPVRQSDDKIAEIKNFISGSLEPQINVGAINDEVIDSAGKIKKAGFIRFSILAAAAIISVFLLIRTLTSGNAPGRLYSSYYRPYPAVTEVTRSKEPASESDYQQIVELYKRKEYTEAVNVYKLTGSAGSSDLYSKFFAGLSSLELHDYDQAITWLSPIAKDSNGDLGKDATWYLGLAYLGNGDTGNAKKSFEQLSRDEGYYKTYSGKILRRLK